MIPVWPFQDGPFPTLGDHEVHVWKCRLTADAAELATRLAVLSPDEQDRVSQFRLERPRDQFLIARSTVRALLGRYLGVAPRAIAFERSAHGKPRLGSPSSTLEFNVSHSHDLALFAFSAHGPVGVDVEWLGRDIAHADVAKRFFSEREQAQLNDVPAAARHRAFVECWTRKEAYLKAHGSGLSRDTRTFSVSLGIDGPSVVMDEEADVVSGGPWMSWVLTPDSDYCAALVSNGGAGPGAPRCLW